MINHCNEINTEGAAAHRCGSSFCHLWRQSGGGPACLRAAVTPLEHLFKKYYTQTGEVDDLISIGTIGLIKAVNTYRPDKKIKLATYAARCIENAILTPIQFSGAGQQPVSFSVWARLVTDPEFP